MTLWELTGQESGIVIYDDSRVAVVNWSAYNENEVPMRASWGDMIQWRFDHAFENVKEKTVADITKELPFDNDGEIDVIYDENNDIEELLGVKRPTAGKVFRLVNVNQTIIAPEGWN